MSRHISHELVLHSRVSSHNQLQIGAKYRTLVLMVQLFWYFFIIQCMFNDDGQWVVLDSSKRTFQRCTLKAYQQVTGNIKAISNRGESNAAVVHAKTDCAGNSLLIVIMNSSQQSFFSALQPINTFCICYQSYISFRTSCTFRSHQLRNRK